ncbi:MAG TPA: thioredoxin-dependent thiol peroxidase [Actinomycetota bacterium]|nr:thioredoxin-dependent thiol peroxidase [Actinomycetota bacterium]
MEKRLEKGMPAPDFELRDANGRTWRLADLKGKRVILYFYPKDDTPGCTAQACDFRDSYDSLTQAGYVVLGVSPQGADSHRAFTNKYSLNFPLLIDEDHAVADSYGAWGEKSNYGKTSMGIIRSTFVIDENGIVEEARYGVKAQGHVARLKQDLGLA